MTEVVESDWFAARTSGAPDVLRQRAEYFFLRESPGDLASRLSLAGRAALAAATRDGAGRAAALDLLAADALITLALRLAAEEDPRGLGAAATRLRLQAAATS